MAKRVSFSFKIFQVITIAALMFVLVPVNSGYASGGDVQPDQVVLVSPSGNIGTETQPVYQWKMTPNATKYLLRVNTATGAKVLNKWYEATDICGAGVCMVRPSKALASGTYIWKVKAEFGQVQGLWSLESEIVVNVSGGALGKNSGGQNTSAQPYMVKSKKSTKVVAVGPSTQITPPPEITITPTPVSDPESAFQTIEGTLADCPDLGVGGGQCFDPSMDKPQPYVIPNQNVVWSAGLETGDISEWSEHGGFVQRNPTDTYQVTSALAHKGNYSLGLTIDTTAPSPSGAYAAYMFIWDYNFLSEDAYYYSAWYYLPEGLELGDWWNWWNIMQWKSTAKGPTGPSSPIFVLDISENNGHFDLRLIQFPDKSYKKIYNQSIMAVPFGRWFHIEGYYRRSQTTDGQVIIWLDGVEIFNVSNVITALADNTVYWSVNNYTEHMETNPYTIYVDDLAISKSRVGAN